MTLFQPTLPPHGSWNHHRRRSDAIAAGFPPLLPARVPGERATPSLELVEMQRWISRYPAEWRVSANSQHRRIPIIVDCSATFQKVYTEALVALDALKIAYPEPYASDAAFAAFRLEAAEASHAALQDDESEFVLETASEVWRIFEECGYGCLGIYDGYPLTYLVEPGSGSPEEKEKAKKRSPKQGKLGAVPSSSRAVPGTVPISSSQFPIGERELLLGIRNRLAVPEKFEAHP